MGFCLVFWVLYTFPFTFLFIFPVNVSKKTFPQSVADCFVSNKLNNVALLNFALGCRRDVLLVDVHLSSFFS